MKTAPTLTGVSLIRRLAALDAKVLRSVRQPGEPAETYLRRVAARRGGVGQRDGVAVTQALNEHFEAFDAARQQGE